jgi:hypothetical protein
VLGDFFVATRFVEGQLQPDFQESAIYRRQGARWVAGRLTNPVEAPLAASRDASLMAAAVYDAGCCGWINESSDLLHLLRGAAKTTIYDEWARFNNRNYDASFPVANARFNPAATLLAYTIGADAPPSGEEIRLSADGKPDAAELARIRAAAADHPWVEIVDAQSAAAKPVVIRHAELAGWLDAERVLVVENGRLVVYDRAGANRRDTGVEVRRAADVFVR